MSDCLIFDIFNPFNTHNITSIGLLSSFYHWLKKRRKRPGKDT